MRGLANDRTLVLLIIVLLAIIVGVVQYRSLLSQSQVQLDSYSDEPSGASALRAWATALDYSIAADPRDTYRIPDNTALVFLLEPFETITTNDWETLSDWIDDGGILVSAANQTVGVSFFSQRLGVQQSFGALFGEDRDRPPFLEQASPLMNNPPIAGEFESLAFFPTYLDRDVGEADVLLTRNGDPVMIAYPFGDGWVIVTTETGLFSNEGLHAVGNQAVALNLLRLAGPEQQIWFDEWHHGRRDFSLSPDEANLSGPLDWLRFTAPGRSVLFTIAVLFLFVTLSGRHLGRPEPLPESLERRGSAEYVEAVSRLIRETGDTQVVSQHYYTQLRRQLTKSYRLPADLSDQELVQQVALRDQQFDQDKTLKQLTGLKQAKLSEQALIELLTDN